MASIKHTAEELKQIAGRHLARIRAGEPMLTVIEAPYKTVKHRTVDMEVSHRVSDATY